VSRGRGRGLALDLLGAALLVAALLLAALLVPSCAPARARPAAADPGGCAGLTVMTWNIHHGARADDTYDLRAIVDVIAAEGADIAGLQEVDAGWTARSGHDDQPALLIQWTGHHGCYGPNLVNAAGGRYGNLILSRHPILECRNHLLPTPPGKEQRGMVEALVDVNGERVRVIDTHLGLSGAERKPQVDAVATLAADSLDPVVLLGDFNATPGPAGELAPLSARHSDAWAVAGEGPGLTMPSDAPRARIDFIWLSAAFGVRCVRVPPTRASDHLPVVAVVYGR
jgi:endonuclease/exonuclease/phosphatase family metal-dependent hydrolase